MTLHPLGFRIADLAQGSSVIHDMSNSPASPVVIDTGEKTIEPDIVSAEPLRAPVASRRPVYGEFFGLLESPFNLTPDPRFLYLTKQLREALSNVSYGLGESKGLTVIIGDAGTGKTTIVKAALSRFAGDNMRFVLISNPTLGRAEFYELLAKEFGFSLHAARSKTQFLSEFEADLRQRAAAGGVTALIVDEAQSMSYELLEEIRLLGNIETPTTKLLNIVLSGQPELADRLNEPSLRQLKQRVALRCHLGALGLDDLSAYIAGRLRIAGGVPETIFTKEAIDAIYAASAGIPRSINVISDNVLLSAFASHTRPITAAIVTEVCGDFDFAGPIVTAKPPAPEVIAKSPVAERQASVNKREQPAVSDRALFGAVYEKKKNRFSFFS